MKTLMSAMRDENRILNDLDLEKKKRAIDEKMVSNKKLRDDSIANGKDANKEDYVTAFQEFVQKKDLFWLRKQKLKLC